MWDIVNNSAADCSKSLKFYTGFVHMTPEVPQQSGQSSRSQRDVIWAKFWQIMNNLAGDCSISIKLTTDYDHETPDLQQTFKTNVDTNTKSAWHVRLITKYSGRKFVNSIHTLKHTAVFHLQKLSSPNHTLNIICKKNNVNSTIFHNKRIQYYFESWLMLGSPCPFRSSIYIRPSYL